MATKYKRHATVLAGILALAGAAQAQNTYQAEQFRLDICKVVGMRANGAWLHREAGKPYPMHTIDASPVKVLEEWAVEYATKEAGSQEEAIKVSFMKCMDNVDRVFRDARQGATTSKADLK